MPPATPPATGTAHDAAAGHVEHPPVSAAARAAAPPHPPRPAGLAAAPAFARPSGSVTSLPSGSVTSAPSGSVTTAPADYFAGPAVAAVGRAGGVVSGSPAVRQARRAATAAPSVVPFARPAPRAAAPQPAAHRPGGFPVPPRPSGPATIPAGDRFAAPAANGSAVPSAYNPDGDEHASIAGSIGPSHDVPAPDLSPADAAANRVLDTLMKLGHRVRGVLDARFSGMKMTDARYMALRVVQDSAPEGCTQAKLAAALGQCESSVSTLVERMRTGKLVYRLHPKSDRRKRVLLLTDLGRDALRLAEAARAEAAKELCEALTHEERDGLCEVLGRLLEGVRQSDADAGRRRKVA